MRHFIIPDTQCKPTDTDFRHLTAAGMYIAEKKPEVIIHMGDHFDMHSLSSYDKGTKKAEGARYQDDIDAGIEGMDALMAPIYAEQNRQRRRKEKIYNPVMHFLLGNHEERIMRHVNFNPELAGKLGYADLELEKHGWIVHDFLELVELDGITYGSKKGITLAVNAAAVYVHGNSHLYFCALKQKIIAIGSSISTRR